MMSVECVVQFSSLLLSSHLHMNGGGQYSHNNSERILEIEKCILVTNFGQVDTSFRRIVIVTSSTLLETMFLIADYDYSTEYRTPMLSADR